MRVEVENDGNGNPVFIGWAAPGAATSAAVWRIAKLEYTGDVFDRLLWADGNTKLDNVWDDRAGLTYT